jgi:hypothetical protein
VSEIHARENHSNALPIRLPTTWLRLHTLHRRHTRVDDSVPANKVLFTMKTAVRILVSSRLPADAAIEFLGT